MTTRFRSMSTPGGPAAARSVLPTGLDPLRNPPLHELHTSRGRRESVLRAEATIFFVRRWRRWIHGKYGTHYQRLAVLVVALNCYVFRDTLRAPPPGPALTQVLADAVAYNLAAAALIRQQYIVNLLFRLATSVPVTWPLRIRRWCGKVYHFGGIHVGAAASAVVWYAWYVWVLVRDPATGHFALLLGAATLALMVRMVVHALPPLRQRFHDRFEQTHRFGGWAVLVLMGVQVITPGVAGAPDWAAVAENHRTWLLVAVLVSVALPWCRLRRVPVVVDKPSNHVAILSFDYGVTPFAGSSTPLAKSPLGDWHSFANIPYPNLPGFRLAVSNAGNWTNALVTKPPTHLWTKGIPTAGVGNIDKLFSKVLWVATGSGIGPCLPHLLACTEVFSP